jgi:HPt (histidine-containing phosphotransfer) domain-containing protein
MEYKVISPEYLENVTGGDLSIKEEIVTIFKDQIPEFVTEMNDLYQKGAYFELGLLAHKAKSSVAIMGMESTAVMLKTFELQAKAGENKDSYKGYINQFVSETSLAIKELDHYLGK